MRYRIISPDGEHVATVKDEQVVETVDHYNAQREHTVDGEPIGEYVAVPYSGSVAGDS